MKKVLIFLAAMLCCMSAYSQDKQLTLGDCIYMNRDIFPKRPNNLQWIEGTDDYSYLRNDTLFRGRIGKKDNVIITFDDLNKAYKNCAEAKETELYRMPRVSWINANEFTFFNNYTILKYNLKEKRSQN